MERNWLIRTSQNQILGPVAKQKLLEFIEKGALGLNDEVASGNGYWFALRERELVEKYIYGDIPQGYNPISESKSVLSKRENPDKTTSINTAPANRGQFVKVETTNNEPGILPKNDDLEFPDVDAIRTKPQSQVENTDITRLPSADDLEFPDITLIAKNTVAVPVAPSSHAGASASASTPSVTPKARPAREESSSSSEQIVYPKDDDLDFPDVEAIKKAEDRREKTLEFKIDPSVTQTVAIPKELTEKAVSKSTGPRDLESDFGDLGELTLTMVQPKNEAVKEAPEKKEAKKEHGLKLERKKEQVRETHKETPRESVKEEDKKLLHDRRVKSAQPAKPVRENREVVSIETAPPQLKKEKR